MHAQDSRIDGRTQWETRERIVAILSSDPVFDKSQRFVPAHGHVYEKC